MSSPTLSFDGTDDWVDIGDKSGLESSPLSVSVWTYANTLSNTNKRLIDKAPDSGFTGGYRLLNNTSGAIEAQFGGGSGGADVVLPFDENTWTHLCVTQDSNGNVDGYVNGEKVGSDTNNNSLTSSVPFKLGKQNANTHYWDGQMDDVRVFRDTLSQSEVQTVMNGGIIGTETVHYSMNEGTGTTLTDATDNNYTGTIHGASWSTRSDGNTYNWTDGDDWVNYQSRDGINAITPNEEQALFIEQPLNHLVGTSEEARYLFGSESSESELVDVSSADNDSVTTNNISHAGTSNKFYGYYYFDGSSSYVELPSIIQSQTNDISTEFWFYPYSEGRQQLIDSQGFYQIFYDRNGSNGINVGIYGDNNTFATNLSTNQWHHVNMYWDNNIDTLDYLAVSVNGDDWSTFNPQEAIGSRSNPWYLGRNSNDLYYFHGELTNLRFVADQQIPIEESLYLNEGTLTTGQKPYNG